jgi:hypothetical protein
MDGLNPSSILNLHFVLDCLPPFVKKFWSPSLNCLEICQNF